VPRIGGIPSMLALAGWFIFLAATHEEFASLQSAWWIVCLLPGFAGGLAEDLSGRAGIHARLWLVMAGAALGWWLLDAQLIRFGTPEFDQLLGAAPWISLFFTVIMAAGAAHSVNIIDGYNGLAGTFIAGVLAATLWVALQVGDTHVAWIAAGGLAATLGFLAWNFPYGKIFLGDGGAYSLGLFIALLLLALVKRNPDVSPMFPAVLLCYPVLETLFSAFRKRRRGQSPAQPDGLHLHMLVYKRLLRSADATHGNSVLRNSCTTLYLAVFTAGAPLLAATLWNQQSWLLGVFLACMGMYLIIYVRLVRFGMPAMFSIRRRLLPKQPRPERAVAFD
jgi:UDP-N-acetylmuramyl pentapeptide phosphotransferase/UDP-N-acetylglucosamine-1-phosphate transferase